MNQNRIKTFQAFLQQYGIEFLAESDCNRILAEYGALNNAHVECPYKPRKYLTKASGNALRTNVHLVFDKQRPDWQGIGSVAFGDTPFEAKLNYVCSLLQNNYFTLTADLKVNKPLIFN